MRIRLWPAATLLLLACSKAPAPAPAAAFTLPGLSGKSVSLSDFSGKVVLLDFWATWCEPCQEEAPDLLRLHETYAKRGFVILGASMDARGAEVVAPYVRARNIAYPIVLTGGDPLPGYRVPGLPTAFLIDRKGFVVKRYLGAKSFKEVASDLEPLL